jgi:hypothetical protein
VTPFSAIGPFGSERSSATAMNSTERAGLAAASTASPRNAASLRSGGRAAQTNMRTWTGSTRVTRYAKAVEDGVKEAIEPSAADAISTILSFER